MTFDTHYRGVMRNILDFGEVRPNRTQYGTIALPSAWVQHDLRSGFPLLTLRRIPFKSVAVELEGFLHAQTSKRWYQDRGCTIWDEWCSPEVVKPGHDPETLAAMKATDYLGPIYGSQWRNFGAVDQLEEILEKLRTNPSDRRMICSAWNPPHLWRMALPPCHVLWQVLVINGRLHLNWYQRSADWFLGVPFNMASYALLATLLARQFRFQPGIVSGFFGDSHLYENQIDAAREVVSREPRPVPRIEFNDGAEVHILDWTHQDCVIADYDPHPGIKVDVAV